MMKRKTGYGFFDGYFTLQGGSFGIAPANGKTGRHGHSFSRPSQGQIFAHQAGNACQGVRRIHTHHQACRGSFAEGTTDTNQDNGKGVILSTTT